MKINSEPFRSQIVMYVFTVVVAINNFGGLI